MKCSKRQIIDGRAEISRLARKERTDREDLSQTEADLEDVCLERTVRGILERFWSQLLAVLLALVAVAGGENTRDEPRCRIGLWIQHVGELKVVEVVADRERPREMEQASEVPCMAAPLLLPPFP
jgi:hypothetical protein